MLSGASPLDVTHAVEQYHLFAAKKTFIEQSIPALMHTIVIAMITVEHFNYLPPTRGYIPAFTRSWYLI